MEVFQFHNNLSTNFNCVHHFEQEAWKIHQFAQPYNLEFIEQVSYLCILAALPAFGRQLFVCEWNFMKLF